MAATSDSIARSKRSLHLPQSALEQETVSNLLASWAIMNMAVVLWLVSTLWWREICPIRKAGPVVATQASNLRPVEYTDDLGGLFDALWQANTKSLLDTYSAPEQAGGKYDAILIGIRLPIALQVRRKAALRTLLQKADLFLGFDIVWRDRVRLVLVDAGIVGRIWLVAYADMECDPMHVRLGPLVGTLANVLHTSVGQGRHAVQLFSSLARKLAEAVNECTIGVGLDPPRPAVRAFASCTAPNDNLLIHGPHRAPVLQAVNELASEPIRQNDCANLMENMSAPQRLLLLDMLATNTVLISLFVDDSFVLQSTFAGLRTVNKSLNAFCTEWKHRFKGGSKRPLVMCVGAVARARSGMP